MKGGGYYDDHSAYQRKTAAAAGDLIAASVDAIRLPPAHRAFVVADYGASTGRNSIESIQTAIDAVLARRPGQRIAVIHNDLPTNDWNQLFANVTASGQAPVPLASAISFFEPAAPAASVHLGLSFAAAHWLRSQPEVVVPEGFYFCEATGAARAALTAQARADWTSFLASRAIDLAPGGRLLVQTVGTDGPRVTARALLRAMAEVAHDLVGAGTLAAAAVDRYVLPVYARTVVEALAPLEQKDSPLAGAFEIVECRTDPVSNPYFERWTTDHDSAAYARAYAGFVRAFTESSLRSHLFAPGALGATPETALDDYFARLERRFAADPARDRFEDWTLTVLVERTRISGRRSTAARSVRADG